MKFYPNGYGSSVSLNLFLRKKMMPKHYLIVGIIFLAMPAILAQDNVWTGVTDNDWSDPSNWSAGIPLGWQEVLLPISGDSVIIPPLFSARANSIVIEQGVLLRILNNASLRLNASDSTAIHNFGTIICNGELDIEDANKEALINEESGSINIWPASTLYLTRVDAQGIVNYGTIFNEGKIIAEGLENRLLYNHQEFTNAGTIEACNNLCEPGTTGLIWNHYGGSLINTDGAAIIVKNISGDFCDGIRNWAYMQNQGLISIDDISSGRGINNYSTLVNNDSIVITNIHDGTGLATTFDSLFNTASAHIIIQHTNGENSAAGLKVNGFMLNKGSVTIDSVNNGGNGLEIHGCLINFDSILISNIIAGEGILNTDSLFNGEQGYIAVDRVPNVFSPGINNSDFIENKGKVEIKTIQFDSGLCNNGTFLNHGDIEISFIENGNGLINYDTFYNGPGALVTISEIDQGFSTKAGLHNFASLENHGEIIIMDIDNGDGLINDQLSTLVNGPSGSIDLFNILGSSITVKENSIFDNQGELDANDN